MDPSSQKPDDASAKSDEMDKLIRRLDIKERETEKEFAEMSRPNIVGSHRLNWDGVVNAVANFMDNIMWKIYGKDVDYHKQRESNRAQQKQKEAARLARKTGRPNNQDY